MFKINESPLDRVIRAVLSLVLLLLGIFVASGVFHIVLIILGAILGITAITGFCLLYSILGVCTLKEKQ
jgi:hypothetical protein